MPDNSSWQMAIVIVVLLSAAGWWLRRLWRMLHPASESLAGACGGCSACPSATPGATRPGDVTTTFIPLEALANGALVPPGPPVQGPDRCGLPSDR